MVRVRKSRLFMRYSRLQAPGGTTTKDAGIELLLILHQCALVLG